MVLNRTRSYLSTSNKEILATIVNSLSNGYSNRTSQKQVPVFTQSFYCCSYYRCTEFSFSCEFISVLYLYQSYVGFFFQHWTPMLLYECERRQRESNTILPAFHHYRPWLESTSFIQARLWCMCCSQLCLLYQTPCSKGSKEKDYVSLRK